VLLICALAGKLVATPANATASPTASDAKPLLEPIARSTQCLQPMFILLQVNNRRRDDRMTDHSLTHLACQLPVVLFSAAKTPKV
jgi:hypothetical protein